ERLFQSSSTPGFLSRLRWAWSAAWPTKDSSPEFPRPPTGKKGERPGGTPPGRSRFRLLEWAYFTKARNPPRVKADLTADGTDAVTSLGAGAETAADGFATSSLVTAGGGVTTVAVRGFTVRTDARGAAVTVSTAVGAFVWTACCELSNWGTLASGSRPP